MAFIDRVKSSGVRQSKIYKSQLGSKGLMEIVFLNIHKISARSIFPVFLVVYVALSKQDHGFG